MYTGSLSIWTRRGRRRGSSSSNIRKTSKEKGKRTKSYEHNWMKRKELIPKWKPALQICSRNMKNTNLWTISIKPSIKAQILPTRTSSSSLLANEWMQLKTSTATIGVPSNWQQRRNRLLQGGKIIKAPSSSSRARRINHRENHLEKSCREVEACNLHTDLSRELHIYQMNWTRSMLRRPCLKLETWIKAEWTIKDTNKARRVHPIKGVSQKAQ